MTGKLRSLSKTKKFKSNFLSEDKSNIQVLLDKISEMYSGLSGDLPRYPIKRFKYTDAVNANFFTENGCSRKQVIKNIQEMFDGVISWYSPYTTFNITTTPLLDTVAASTVTNLLNPNCLWDFACGKFVLIEKNIIHLLGKTIFNSNSSDGFSTFGGKGTLFYAIKTGLSNCDIAHKKNGLSGDYVVICSYVSHFCLADVCDYVGIGTNNLIRVPLQPNREMDYNALEKALEKAIQDKKKIAAVICNGGITLDFCMDNAKKIRSITDKIEKKYKLPYKIHIHGDMVFGWAWRFADEKYLKDCNEPAAKKILKIRSMLKNMTATDSIGVDFHKMGLCPHNSSFFVLKNGQNLDLLGGAVTAQDNGLWGNKHLHYNSLENSKSGTGIISAYTALCTLGSRGIAEYLLYLMHVRETYMNLIETKFKHIFTILNKKSLGFEVVFRVSIDGKPFTKEDYINLCNGIWYAEKPPYIVSQVLRYFRNGKPEPALLIYSMSPHVTEKHCLNLLTMLEKDCRNLAKNRNKATDSIDNLFVPK